MLVGNYAQLPIRYSYIATDTGGMYEELRFPSDLYYADLYTANGSSVAGIQITTVSIQNGLIIMLNKIPLTSYQMSMSAD
jgi:hypothetical protein